MPPGYMTTHVNVSMLRNHAFRAIKKCKKRKATPNVAQDAYNSTISNSEKTNGSVNIKDSMYFTN